MKNLFGFTLALAAALTLTSHFAPQLAHFMPDADARIMGAPFLPESDSRFDCLETGSTASCKGQPGLTALSIPFSKLIQGSATNASGQFAQGMWKSAPVSLAVAAGTQNTTIVLPAKTVIRQAWLMFPVAPANLAGTTTAVQCDSANDILSAADETAQGAASIIPGVETGTAATMHYSSAGCTVKVVSAVHTGTLGNVVVYLETFPAN